MFSKKLSDCNLSNQKSALSILCITLFLIITFNTSAKASVAGTLDQTITEIKNEALEVSADTSKVYRVVDKMPEIIGGVKAIYENISYPRQAIRNGIEGRVFITFVVDKNGNVKQPRILRDIGGGCGEAAISAIKKVKFTPGRKDNQVVKVQYSLPITFKLQ